MAEFNQREFLADIMRVAERFMDGAGGRMQVVEGEKDKSREKDPEAGMFLKLDGERFGRDFAVYTFMAENYHPGVPMSEMVAMAVLLTAKGLGKSVGKALPVFKSMVKYLQTPDQIDRWKAIFATDKIADYKDFNIELPGENPATTGLTDEYYKK